MDNSVGIDCGSGGWDGQQRAKGEKWDNCSRIVIKKIFKNMKNERSFSLVYYLNILVIFNSLLETLF